MSNSIALQDFLTAFLTKRQKALLVHQKSRVAQINESDQGSKGDKFTDFLGKFDKERFE